MILVHPLLPPKGGGGGEGDGNGADVKSADPGNDDAGTKRGNDAPADSTAGDDAVEAGKEGGNDAAANGAAGDDGVGANKEGGEGAAADDAAAAKEGGDGD